MEASDTQESSKKTCFNFCFWAKCIVAVPALPIAGYIAMVPFADSSLRWIAAGFTVFILVYFAIKVDRMSALQKKIISK